jgi:hypothetical protein
VRRVAVDRRSPFFDCRRRRPSTGSGFGAAIEAHKERPSRSIERLWKSLDRVDPTYRLRANATIRLGKGRLGRVFQRVLAAIATIVERRTRGAGRRAPTGARSDQTKLAPFRGRGRPFPESGRPLEHRAAGDVPPPSVGRRVTPDTFYPPASLRDRASGPASILVLHISAGSGQRARKSQTPRRLLLESRRSAAFRRRSSPWGDVLMMIVRLKPARLPEEFAPTVSAGPTLP